MSTDLTGWVMKEHGVPNSRLTVIGRDYDNPKKGQYWLCKCECGNICSVKRENLIRKDTKGTRSCGCMHQEVVNRFTKIHYNDLTGQRFGKLVCIEPIKSGAHNYIMWKCQCDCGNICSVLSRDLLDGSTKSCGCIKSVGEWIINKWLTEHQYSFEREFSFDDLVYINQLRFDFKIDLPNTFILIEYQGIQHYDVNHIWYTKESHLRDEMKKKYCEEKGIQLFEISETNKEEIIQHLENILKGANDAHGIR